MCSTLKSFWFIQSILVIFNPQQPQWITIALFMYIIGSCYFTRCSTHQALAWATSSHPQSTTKPHAAAFEDGSAELTCQRWQIRMPKAKELQAVPSRQWSCSELVEGHRKLVAAKEERESDDELNQRIQDCSFDLAYVQTCLGQMASSWTHMIPK